MLQAFYNRLIIDSEWKPFGQIASLVRRRVNTKPDEEYEEMGIRSFGKGTFKKPVLTGRQIGNKRIYRIHVGDLVFNNVFAWGKAIAVAREEDHDRVGSHRFITYVPHEKKVTSEFLCHHFLNDRGIRRNSGASPVRQRKLDFSRMLKNLNFHRLLKKVQMPGGRNPEE